MSSPAATSSPSTAPAQRAAVLAQLAGLPFAKGHGTGNDFVLVADPAGERILGEAEAAALCDRHLGIGADGLIRAIRSAELPEGRAVLAEEPAAEWFMDYRNADGSLSEMCGNGVRAFVAFLIDQGLADNFLQTGLRPWLLEEAVEDKDIKITMRNHERYDHSYYFISSFMDDHLRWHAERLAK